MAEKTKQTEVDEYSLCLSFTRTLPVPWFFVLYATNSPTGLRLRAKADSELTPISNTSPSPPANQSPNFRFLARENAYVHNFKCHGRVVIRSGMSVRERDAAQKVIENTQLSAMENGRRDCQKWVTECLPGLGFDGEFVGFWTGVRGLDIWGIEKAVEGREGLVFLRGPAYGEKVVG